MRILNSKSLGGLYKRLTAVVILACSALFVPAFAEQVAPNDYMLRVGLQYGSVKDQSVQFYSESGYRFGLFSAGNFIDILSIAEKDLYLVKNGLSDNESLITADGTTPQKTYGKYHIQFGQTQTTYEAVLLILDRARTLDSDAYLAYDGGWRVYTGAYFTEGERSQKLTQLQAMGAPVEILNAPMNYNAFMAVAGSKVKILFSTLEVDFGVMSAAQNGVMSFNKYKYRGGLVVKRYKDSDPTVINYIGLEPYLYGVLPYEISPKWPIEAQKAQAVAARNYAMTSIDKHKKYGFDVCNTTDCQVYVGYNVESPLSNSAVDLTKGNLLKYNGKLASTFFHSNSGGRTENSENVWSTALPYLVAVDDPYSVGSPNDVWSVSYTPEQIKQILANKKVNIGDITKIVAEKVSVNGRIQKLTFVGTAGQVSYEKDKIRSVFDANVVKSIWFTISTPGAGLVVESASGQTVSPAGTAALTAAGSSSVNVGGAFAQSASGITTLTLSSNLYVFSGKGWGHGIGMSQWGAKKMAESGFTYEDILTHYYQNTYIEKQ